MTTIDTSAPFIPVPHTDRAYYAPCLKRRRTHNQAGRLTDDQVLEIRHRYETEPITQQALADQYGVGRTTISQITLRHAWTELEEAA